MSASKKQSEYENFDVSIERQTDDMYTIRAEYSRGGEDKVTGRTFPLNSSEFQNLLGALAALTGDPDQAEAAGELMREHLFPGDVWALFTNKQALAENDGKGLRLRLRIEPPEISMLPWEYCFDKDYEFFALSRETPVVRYIDLPFTPEAIQAPRPFKVLLVTASPEGMDALDVEGEAAQIGEELQGLEGVEVEVLHHVTWDALQVRLNTFEPHVLHFIGHGEFDLAKGRGKLVLEGGAGRPHKIRPRQLASLLRGSSVKVVMLNACKTAFHSRSSAFMGIAPALVRAEIPAVIAMQFAIPDQTARRFAQQLYRYLALGEPLDSAITEARINVYGYDEVFWAIPVLFMRAPDGVIWQPTAIAPTRPQVAPPDEGGKSSVYLKGLREKLTRYFDREELRTLCFDLGIDYDSLRGEGKAGEVRELVALLDRSGRLPELASLVEQQRPNVSWDDAP